MNRKSDILVVGSGVAGISAALRAAEEGKSVTLITHGVGSLAISNGCIDVLGYVDGQRVCDPFDAIDTLSEGHPYRLVGKDQIRASVDWLQNLCLQYGLPMAYPKPPKGNQDLITVMGTMKPSYLCSESCATNMIHDVHRVAVVTVENMKDVHPALIIDQLKRYEIFSHTDFSKGVLSCPVQHAHRNITPLDIARYVETPEGFTWLMEALRPYARLYSVILLPPICGMQNSHSIWKRLCEALKVRLVEMVSIPPGVTGLRLRDILKKALNAKGVYLIENAEVIRTETKDGFCRAVFTLNADGERRWEAGQFIIATGGLLGGGISTLPGKAYERIFGIPLDMPECIEDWSSPNIFGENLFARMGVQVNTDLKPVASSGEVLFHNVRFAGRVLSSYDFAAEKSGHGVALATGCCAGKMAAKD